MEVTTEYRRKKQKAHDFDLPRKHNTGWDGLSEKVPCLGGTGHIVVVRDPGPGPVSDCLASLGESEPSRYDTTSNITIQYPVAAARTG
jgi:hypothetical protein